MSELLKNCFDKVDIECSNRGYELFDKYMEGILRYNKSINLTAIVDRDEFQVKHFLDSALICKLKEYKDAESVIDMGTGGGFPGVPLAILSEDKMFTLADSLMKKIKIVQELTAEYGIHNISAIHGRAEEIGRKTEYRERFDLCVSRAVADLAILSEYCLPLVRVGGYFIPYKGSNIAVEVNNATKAIKTMGGELVRVEKVSTGGFEHSMVVIKKIKETPSRYPRDPGKPRKAPIK